MATHYNPVTMEPNMDLTKLIEATLMTPLRDGSWGLPLVFVGEPGTAKTSIVGQVCKRLGLPMETLILAIREPADFLGLPVPAADAIDVTQYVTRYATPAVFANLPLRVLIFLDELSCAPPAVQAGALRMVFERMVGEHPLPEGVRFIAAMNDVGDAAGGWDLAPALANRFGHIDFPTPSLDSWSDWMMGGSEHASGDIVAAERAVLQAWPKAWAKARAKVIAFLRRRPELLHKKPSEASGNINKAWPSLRTWEFATRAIASAEVHHLDASTRDIFAGSFIGEETMVEFVTWEKAADLPNPEDVLDGRIKLTHDHSRPDRTHAVLLACAALLTAVPQKERDALFTQRAELLCETCAAMAKVQADVVYHAVQQMIKAGISRLSNKTMKCMLEISTVMDVAMEGVR